MGLAIPFSWAEYCDVSFFRLLSACVLAPSWRSLRGVLPECWRASARPLGGMLAESVLPACCCRPLGGVFAECCCRSAGVRPRSASWRNARGVSPAGVRAAALLAESSRSAAAGVLCWRPLRNLGFSALRVGVECAGLSLGAGLHVLSFFAGTKNPSHGQTPQDDRSGECGAYICDGKSGAQGYWFGGYLIVAF